MIHMQYSESVEFHQVFMYFSSKVNDFGRFRFEVRSKRFAFDIRAFMIDYCQKEYLDASNLLEDWFLELIKGLG